MAGMAGMAGMVERQKEWQNGSGYISVLGLFLVFSHLTLFVIYHCFGKCCWCWFLIPLAGMAKRQKEWQNRRMAEMDTYVLFMVHADTDNTNDTDDTDDT